MMAYAAYVTTIQGDVKDKIGPVDSAVNLFFDSAVFFVAVTSQGIQNRCYRRGQFATKDAKETVGNAPPFSGCRLLA